jgi:secreted PhoX family phosphatase
MSSPPPSRLIRRRQWPRFCGTSSAEHSSGFNPHYTALFVSVHHPGGGGTIDDPVTLWPIGERTARPTLMMITAGTLMAKVDRGLV